MSRLNHFRNRVFDLRASFKAWLIRWLVYYRVRITGKEKCPACGSIKKHDFKWNNDNSVVLHQCKDCVAIWAQKPIMQAEQWRIANVPLVLPQLPEHNRDGMKIVAREPVAASK